MIGSVSFARAFAEQQNASGSNPKRQKPQCFKLKTKRGYLRPEQKREQLKAEFPRRGARCVEHLIAINRGGEKKVIRRSRAAGWELGAGETRSTGGSPPPPGGRNTRVRGSGAERLLGLPARRERWLCSRGGGAGGGTAWLPSSPVPSRECRAGPVAGLRAGTWVVGECSPLGVAGW